MLPYLRYTAIRAKMPDSMAEQRRAYYEGTSQRCLMVVYDVAFVRLIITLTYQGIELTGEQNMAVPTSMLTNKG